MSVFDSSVFTYVDFSFMMWLGSFSYLVILLSLVYWYKVGRFESCLLKLLSIPLEMVNKSGAGMLGGSHLMISSLFIIILGLNLAGIMGYSFPVSSHLVFAMNFSLSFWLSLVLSSVFMGRFYTSMSSLIFSGVAVFGGMVMCWLELLSVFLRWVTLSVRLVVNMSIGVILSGLFGSVVLIFFFGYSSVWSIMMLLLMGGCFILIEIAVGFVQAYLFCLLLTVYSNEHSV